MNTRSVVCLGLLGLAALGAYWANPWRSLSSTPAPPAEPPSHGLLVAPSYLNLGDIWEQADFTCELPIQNTNDHSVEIEEFSTSCACVGVEPKKLTIPPKETKTIRLTFDVSERRFAELGKSNRPIVYEVEPIFKNREKVFKDKAWKLQAVIRSRVTFDSLGLQIAEGIHGQPAVSRKVALAVHVPFRRLETHIDPKVATVQLKAQKDDPKHFELVVTPHPTLKPGPFKTEVVVDLITNDGKRVRGGKLSVEGQMQDEIRLIPARLILPPGKVGSSATGFIVIDTPPGMSVVVKQVVADSPDVKVEWVKGTEIPLGRTFRISQQINRLGDSSSRLSFTLHREGQGIRTLSTEVFIRGEPNAETQTPK